MDIIEEDLESFNQSYPKSDEFDSKNSESKEEDKFEVLKNSKI